MLSVCTMRLALSAALVLLSLTRSLPGDWPTHENQLRRREGANLLQPPRRRRKCILLARQPGTGKDALDLRLATSPTGCRTQGKAARGGPSAHSMGGEWAMGWTDRVRPETVKEKEDPAGLGLCPGSLLRVSFLREDLSCGHCYPGSLILCPTMEDNCLWRIPAGPAFRGSPVYSKA